MANKITSPIVAIKGVNIFNVFRVKYFEYIYMLVMVIYMGQMTPETGRMVGTLSGNPIPFLIPIVFTVILVFRNGIQWKRNLFLITSILFVWSILSLYKYHAFRNTVDLSYHFFLYYAIIIAYIHIQVFGKRYFYIYEHIMVWMCKVTLVLWMFNILYIHTDISQYFPETNLGNSILYIYNWISPMSMDLVLENAYVLRNSGCSWEPGRFAIMIVLAIYVNLSRNGIRFKKNRSVIWLLFALISTQSTTGYSITLLLYVIFLFNKFSFRNCILCIMVLSPIIYYTYQLDFMGEKVESQMDVKEQISQMQISAEYLNKTKAQDEYAFSLDRFQSIYFEYYNFIHDPLLGYSRNFKHSYFYNDTSSNIVLTSGLMRIFSQYGIFWGLFIYCLLFKSSIKISTTFKEKRRFALFLLILFNSISYPIWCIPVFTTFWLYGSFAKD